VCFRNPARNPAVDVIIALATEFKGVPEEYNTFLHTLGYRPASILHRIDAISYALQFVRFDYMYYIILLEHLY
jgi:hypothetical protein